LILESLIWYDKNRNGETVKHSFFSMKEEKAKMEDKK